MSKKTGLGAGLLVGGVNLSGDIGSVQKIASPRGLFEVPGIDVEAMERILTTKDGGIDYTAYFNPTAARAHPVLSALPRTDQITTYLHRKGLQGSVAAVMVGKQINYDGNRAQDGSLLFNVSALGNAFGLEWGHTVTENGITTSTSAESLDGYDDGAGVATDFGLQAYLQVSAFTGTSITVKLQDSDDNASTDPYTDITGAAFTAVSSAPTAQRIQTSRTENVKEWIRVVTTGTYSNAVFNVVVVRNLFAVNF